MKFTASATAQGYAFTDNKTLVTSSATASGISNVSYEEALVQATELAQEEANLTANYDANLINQSVNETLNITTEKMNYNMMQINSPPDLTFYFSYLSKYLNIYETNLGSIAIERNSETPIFSDIDLTSKIGFSTSKQTIYTTTNINDFYQQMNIKSFILPNGTLFYVNQNQVYKNNIGNYVSKDGTYLLQIVSGSGEYLNKSGIISLNINNETGLRTVNVYLNNY